MPRRYNQFCALARALDVVGERWTLLIVRELLLGPKRFTDLLAALPGIGRNLLAARLHELKAAGVLEAEPGSGPGPVPG
nr:helix-turn-helix transcriptional regulator [Actinomycetota bacterium]